MRQLHSGRVEGEGLAPRAAISVVAHHWQAMQRELCPDLMLHALARPHLEQRIVSAHLVTAGNGPVGDCVGGGASAELTPRTE